MLRSLHIVNFALIDQGEISFGQGLNIMTGETGAGKSIIIGAFSMVLGNRASIDLIRSGCDYFLVEAVFDGLDSAIKDILKDQHIILEEDDLIISRRFSKNGKNSVLINGHHVPLNLLRQLGQRLVDIHGQHENQGLLRAESHLMLLDSFNEAVKRVHAKYAGQYREWIRVSQQLADIEQNTREAMQRQDMLGWQTTEIDAAALRIGEDEEIEQELKVLTNSEKIANNVRDAYSLLNSGDEDEQGLLTNLGKVSRQLGFAAQYDDRLGGYLTAVHDALYSLEEVANRLRDYIDEFDFDPERLSFLQQRMDTIYNLKKKYGATVEEILQYQRQALDELQQITNQDSHIAELKKDQEKIYAAMSTTAAKLSHLRQSAAKKLSQEITLQLRSLAMPQAEFIVQLAKKDYGINGCDEAMFMFSANKGEELKPLIKIASGGELSRIALAIKTVCSQHDAVATMVFDEVDAGIGGETAQKVAEKIAMVALNKQVICITHLPQIACMADKHFHIEKIEQGSRTNSVVYELRPQLRLEELARMISGSQAVASSRQTAGEMIDIAKKKKDKWKNKAQA